jgi:hypothetical protein
VNSANGVKQVWSWNRNPRHHLSRRPLQNIRSSDDDQPSKWRLSPLRILIVVLVVVFAVWYQFNRSDAARDAQAQKDKEFYQKRAEEDNLRHLGDRR